MTGRWRCWAWSIHPAGTFSAADLCLPEADGYTVSFTSGAWDGEIGWSLVSNDGTVALSGGAPGEYTTCPQPCADDELDFRGSQDHASVDAAARRRSGLRTSRASPK